MTVVGVAHEIAATEVERHVTAQVETEIGIEGHEACVAWVALCIGVVEVETCLAHPFGTIVALPSEDMEIVGIDIHVANLCDIHAGLDLGRETATHIIVALLNKEIVAERTAKQDAAEEDALLQIHAILQMGEAIDKARAYRGCLADAVGDEVGTVFHSFRVVEIEVLEDTEERKQRLQRLQKQLPKPK